MTFMFLSGAEMCDPIYNFVSNGLAAVPAAEPFAYVFDMCKAVWCCCVVRLCLWCVGRGCVFGVWVEVVSGSVFMALLSRCCW